MFRVELIRRKRDGETLGDREIAAFVNGIASGAVSDAQIGAFAMAVWFRGMNEAEQRALTLAMRDSGGVLEWTGLGGPVLDKHSTGGVGDLVSIVLGPLVAACGGFVPMISGRGLAHTGGTLDKLESIPGFETQLGMERFQRQVREHGVAIIGQTSDLAPADRRLYAIRDVTATVDSVPLIVSSILSKKLAAGLDALVVDVKLGSGAFMGNPDAASRLARELCSVAVGAGVACNALITDMDQPMAWSAGNALEIAEGIAFLTGRERHPRLLEKIIALAAEMLLLGGLEDSAEPARGKVLRALDSGSAAERFARMVAAQGGPADLLDQPGKHLAAAPIVRPLLAGDAGVLLRIDMRQAGLAIVQLGGGRKVSSDAVDPAVGITGLLPPGTAVEPRTPLALIHARHEEDWARAAAMVREAVSIGPAGSVVGTTPVIHQRIAGARPDVRA